MTGKPIKVSDDMFEQKVLQSEIPVLVDFWAPWCAPCRMIAPSLEQIAEEYEGQLLIAKVNTDHNTHYAMEYGVRGIPNLIIFHNGQPIDRIVGVLPYAYLKGRVENALATQVELA